MILIDTSVYISSLADKELEDKLNESAKRSFIISSEVIEKEINEASNYLRSIGKRDDAERLKNSYYEMVSGTIKLTKRVIDLADKYSIIAQKKFSKSKAQKMKDDFRIVASASIGSLKAISTFNRKTMANTDIISIYKEVNKKNKMKTPRFIKTKDELFNFLSSI